MLNLKIIILYYYFLIKILNINKYLMKNKKMLNFVLIYIILLLILDMLEIMILQLEIMNQLNYQNKLLKKQMQIEKIDIIWNFNDDYSNLFQ